MWRLDVGADYGVLNGLARNRIDRELIARNWDDLLRLAGSLKMSTVGAVELLHSLQGGGRVSTLGRALTELGRGPKTLHLLSYFDDEDHRRYIGRHLTRHESRHKLARTVFHGRKGQLRQPYREGMEDQLGALGLVVNVMVLWTTLYMDRALDQLRGLGATVNDEDVARLSPLGTNHINVLGRYHFSLPDAIARGEFRPLRDPSDFDDDVSGGKTPREPRSAMLRACSNSSSCSLQEQHGKLRHGYDNAAADARRVPSTPSRPP